MGLRDTLSDLARNVVGAAAHAAQEWATGGGSLGASSYEAVPSQTEAMVKAESCSGVPTDEQLADPKSMLFDPFAIIEQLGYKERPSAITYGTLKAIVYKLPIVTAVIQTRVNQVASFARPQHDRYDMGFRITTRDPDTNPKALDKKWLREMESLLMTTGVAVNGKRYKRNNFETFLRKITFDSLVYDQLAYEIVFNRKGLPSQWYAVDGASIRIADTTSAYLKQTKLDNETRYVQIYDGMVVTEYTDDELCFGVRNPRTDMRLYGYGTSELEMLMTIITSLLWSMEYNQKFFSQGSTTKGMLNFKGAIPDKQLAGFRRHWYSHLTSVQNAWRMPITNAQDGVEWVKLQETNKDMEFNAWMDFLIKVTCSCFNMDPVEVNFKYGNVGQKGALSETSNKEKITESKERGLRPLLRHTASLINQSIIWPITEDFVFEFVGLDSQTHDDMVKLNAQRVRSTRTIDELRAEDNLDPLPNGMGEVILDPTWLQFAQQKQAQEGGEEPGIPGEPEEGAQDQQKEEAVDFESFFREQGGEDSPPNKTQKSLRKSNGFRINRPLIDLEL